MSTQLYFRPILSDIAEFEELSERSHTHADNAAISNPVFEFVFICLYKFASEQHIKWVVCVFFFFFRIDTAYSIASCGKL